MQKLNIDHHATRRVAHSPSTGIASAHVLLVCPSFPVMVSLSISQDNKKNMIPLRRRRGSHLQCFHSHIENTVARPDLARVSYRCSVLMAETHSDTAAGTPHERSPVFRTDPPPPPPALSLSLTHRRGARAAYVRDCSPLSYRFWLCASGTLLGVDR